MQVDLSPKEAANVLKDTSYTLVNTLERMEEDASPKGVKNILQTVQKMKALLRGIETYLNGLSIKEAE
jgi:hypothetical protein